MCIGKESHVPGEPRTVPPTLGVFASNPFRTESVGTDRVTGTTVTASDEADHNVGRVPEIVVAGVDAVSWTTMNFPL